MSSTTMLLLAYVALAFVAVLACIASSWPRWSKALMVLGVTALYFFAEQALDTAWGWPSRNELPERFVLLAAVIEEPSASHDGAVYLWANPMADNKPAERPRAYQLAYTRDLHTLVDDSMRKVRQGITQIGSAEIVKGQQGLSWLRPGKNQQDVKLRDMPSPQLPEK